MLRPCRSVTPCGSVGRCLCLFPCFGNSWIVTAFDTRSSRTRWPTRPRGLPLSPTPLEENLRKPSWSWRMDVSPWRWCRLPFRVDLYRLKKYLGAETVELASENEFRVHFADCATG